MTEKAITEHPSISALPRRPVPTASVTRLPVRKSVQKLYDANQGLLYPCLKRLTALPDHEREDALQAARVGLWKAAERFDPAKGFQFSTFATRTVQGYLMQWLRQRKQGGRLPCVSLDAPLPGSAEGGTLAEVVPDTHGERPGEKLLEGGGFEERIEGLCRDDQALLRALYGEERSASEVATAWGVTVWAVNRRRNRVLGQLKRNMEKPSLARAEHAPTRKEKPSVLACGTEGGWFLPAP